MSRIYHKICPVCGGQQLDEFLPCYDFSISREDFELVKCRQCGFIITQDVPDEASIGKYYQSDVYISHSDTDKGLVNKLYKIVRAVMLDKKARMVKMQSGVTKGKLLDIGTGLGYFPAHMQNHGWEVTGVEQDAEARRRAQDELKITVHRPEFVYSMEKETWDAVTMWHVLEHVHDLEGYMKAIKTSLKDDGVLVVALPNHMSYDAQFYGRYWAAWDVPRHLWHWNPETFSQFAQKHGFEVFDQKPMPMDGFYVSLLSEKYKRGHGNLFQGFLRGFITWFKLQSDLKHSSSVIYFLRKTD